MWGGGSTLGLEVERTPLPPHGGIGWYISGRVGQIDFEVILIVLIIDSINSEIISWGIAGYDVPGDLCIFR